MLFIWPLCVNSECCDKTASCCVRYVSGGKFKFHDLKTLKLIKSKDRRRIKSSRTKIVCHGGWNTLFSGYLRDVLIHIVLFTTQVPINPHNVALDAQVVPPADAKDPDDETHQVLPSWLRRHLRLQRVYQRAGDEVRVSSFSYNIHT